MSTTTPAERTKIALSPVEAQAVGESVFAPIYPATERMGAIVVESFPNLGKLTALRFIEWVLANPGGVISLPTGKTPEHFIKWVNHLLQNWETPEVRSLLEDVEIDPAQKPDMKSLHFVQIDEFYPINSAQTNSFFYYVNKFYIDGFGLDRDKALLIEASKIGLDPGDTIDKVWPGYHVNLALRYQHAKTHLEEKQKAVLERVDQWCMQYENCIRDLGGIGFFLGGIGPDGHIGFNISGSDHHSTTRLCPINYETQAAAATDLGGIEVSSKRLVITIGLKTITRNPDCTAIVIAAGEAKAKLVAEAMQSPQDVHLPATALHSLPNARFYLTRGAAKLLESRQAAVLEDEPTLSNEQVEQILVDLAARLDRRLLDLKSEDCKKDQLGRILLEKRQEPFEQLTQLVYDSLTDKIERGRTTLENRRFLHTEPHHDDVMLGYFARAVRHFRSASNTHYFMTLTSGFTSVTNHFMVQHLQDLQKSLERPKFRKLLDEGYFRPGNMLTRNRDIWQYLDGVAAQNEEMKAEGWARRMLRNLIEVFETEDVAELKGHLQDLLDYFDKQFPGAIDPPHVQCLKGMCREWEAECVWGYYGWKCDNVMHMRLGFYTGDIFTQEPTRQRDAMPIVEALFKINPDIVTAAFDPEASGPDTHYKVLQAMAEALRIHIEKTGNDDIQVWGYRNVWYRFHPAEATVFVPVSLSTFSVMHQSFMNAFLTQRNASFPSYELDGPFSLLAQQIQVEQYEKIKICLGREWFYSHSSPLIRAARGLLFLKEMTPNQFFKSCRKLRESVEKL